MKQTRYYSEEAIIWASTQTDIIAKWHPLNDKERTTIFRYMLDEYMANEGVNQ